MNRKNLAVSRLAASLALVAVAVAPGAFAATSTANMPVTASVVANCAVSVSPLAFGNYDPIVAHGAGGSDLTASTTIDVACTQGSDATISLGQGENYAGGLRHMANGTEELSYQLYTDLANTNAWPAEGVEYTGTGAGGNSLQVYGRVAKGQDVAEGDYSDAVVVSVNF